MLNQKDVFVQGKSYEKFCDLYIHAKTFPPGWQARLQQFTLLPRDVFPLHF